MESYYRDVVQMARTPVLGTGGRVFKSRHPDHIYENSGSKRTEVQIFLPRFFNRIKYVEQ